MVIEFVASYDPDGGDAGHGAGAADADGDGNSGGQAGALDRAKAMGQLLDALAEIERTREFVSLKWFRDRYLPTRGHDRAADPRTGGALLREATGQRLILTSQVPNPNDPLYPVTAIRINRRHPRFQAERPQQGRSFAPISIRGSAIADTVLDDRR